MIIDKKKRFIFIHNPRTGGTTISKSLLNILSKDVIKELTDKGLDVSNIELNGSGYNVNSDLFNLNVRPRKPVYKAEPFDPTSERLVSGLSTNSDFNFLETVYSDVPNLYFSHPEHYSLYSCTSKHKLDEYKYKFVCVRNPWSRMVSYFMKIRLWLSQNSSPDELQKFTFSYFVEELVRNRSDNNLNYLYEVPQTYWTYGVDEIIHYENLDEKWEDILKYCDLEYQPLLEPGKLTNAIKRKKCSEYYESGENLIEKVAYCFAEEIALFNFDYNGDL
jgi:hypothetical protein